jgi:hypothetical protein
VPRLPGLTNLRILNGPSTASQQTWTNGQASAMSTLSWVLLAERPGPAEIPIIQLRIGASSYRTDPISLQVVKGSTTPRTGRAPGQGAPPAGRPDAAGGPEVLVESKLGSQEVWVGQPVSLSVRSASDLDVTSFNWRAPTRASGRRTSPSIRRRSLPCELGGKSYVTFRPSTRS